MFTNPMQPAYGHLQRPNVLGADEHHGLIPRDIWSVDVRPCALKLCFYSGKCDWSMASDAADMHSPQVQFQHWVERHRDNSTDYMERRTCPLLWCRKVFNSKEQMLEHVSCCELLRKGEYWCYQHQAAERFTSMGAAHLLIQLYQRVHNKVHENHLLTKAKRAFGKVGPKSLQKSPWSSRPSSFDSKTSHEFPDPVAELAGSARFELPAPEHVFELSGDGCPAELMAWESIPYRPTQISSLPGTDPAPSIFPSNKVSNSSLESAVADPRANGVIPISLHLPEHCSGLYTSPSVDRWSTSFNTTQDYTDLVSPLSPVSEIPSPFTYDAERSSTIGTSGDPNKRKLSNHCSSRPISPLDSDERAYPTCFRQPANEQAVQEHGLYSKPFAVPALFYSVPKRHPLPPRQLEGLIAAKKSYSALNAYLPSKVNLEYAQSMEGLLHPPHGEEWSISRPPLNDSSDIGVPTLEAMPSADLPGTTSEGYQAELSSFSKSLTPFHHVQGPEHTCVESTTHLAQGLDMVDSDYTSVIAGTERRLVNGKLPTLSDVGVDLISGVEAQRVFECQDNGNYRVAEGKGWENQGGQGAQRRLQRLNCHPDIASDITSHNYNSPANALSPASSFQSNSGYSSTSPTGSADLCSLPAASPRQEFSPSTKRRRCNVTSPSYHNPTNSRIRDPMSAALTRPPSVSQRDGVKSDFLECPDCGATFGGTVKWRQSNLRKHTRIVHATEPVILECPDKDCRKTFNRRYNLRSHWHKFHPGRTDAELGLSVVTQTRRKPAQRKASQAI